MNATLRTIVGAALLGAGLSAGAMAGDGIGEGARAEGMGGGAFFALADDPSAIYWNPAGLARIRQTQLYGASSFEHEDGRSDASSALAGVFPVGSAGTAAVSMANTGTSFSGGDRACSLRRVTASFATALNKRWLLGTNLHYYQYHNTCNITTRDGNTLGFDVGTVYSITPTVSAGLTFRPETRIPVEGERRNRDAYTRRFNTDEPVVPQRIGAGLGFRDGALSVGAGYEFVGTLNEPSRLSDGSFEYYRRSVCGAGVEYQLFQGIMPLRAGVNYQRNFNDPFNTSYLRGTCGIGFRGPHVAGDVFYVRNSRSDDWTTNELLNEFGCSYRYAF